MVICMAYQFFSADKKKQQERSGLSRRWIWLTIILSAVYVIVAVVNACRYCIVSTIIMTFASATYVFIFFKFMRFKK